MNETPRWLALDISSYNIGHSIQTPDGISYGVLRLEGSLAERCAEAARLIGAVLHEVRATHVVAEGPAGQFLGGILPQARVQGAVYAAVWWGLKKDVQEVSPAAAKLALTKNGKADKQAVLSAALRLAGYEPGGVTFGTAKRRVGKRYLEEVVAFVRGRPVMNEHEADAVAVLATQVPTLVLAAAIS